MCEATGFRPYRYARALGYDAKRLTNTDCTIARNSATGGEGGAGLYCDDGSAPTLIRCVVSQNYTDESGGGLYCIEGASPTLTNCVVADNTARFGGGLYSLVSSPALANCTLTRNLASDGGGALFGPGSDPTFANCILWADTPQELSAGSPTLIFSNIQGGWVGEGNIDADPGFRTYGRFEYLLRPGSPCIDAGDPAIKDSLFDRHPRWPEWYSNGTRSDMGAYGGPGNRGWYP